MMAAYAFVFGLAFGSFVNAAIDRIARRQSLNGRSCCDACGRQLRLGELLPVISYIALRGRCAGCKASIGVRSPVVEVLCAVAYAAAFESLTMPAALIACAGFTVTLAAIGTVVEARELSR